MLLNNCLHRVYNPLDVTINLKMIWSMLEEVWRVYANTTPLHINTMNLGFKGILKKQSFMCHSWAPNPLGQVWCYFKITLLLIIKLKYNCIIFPAPFLPPTPSMSSLLSLSKSWSIFLQLLFLQTQIYSYINITFSVCLVLLVCKWFQGWPLSIG